MCCGRLMSLGSLMQLLALTGVSLLLPPFAHALPLPVQWYAALGYENSRYILYKDTIVDPLLSQ